MAEHPDEPVLQGDTVEGRKGEKCMLTLTWVQWSFQAGFLRDHNNSASVTRIVNQLYESLGYELFHKVFPSVWLLDNGSEFLIRQKLRNMASACSIVTLPLRTRKAAVRSHTNSCAESFPRARHFKAWSRTSLTLCSATSTVHTEKS